MTDSKVRNFVLTLVITLFSLSSVNTVAMAEPEVVTSASRGYTFWLPEKPLKKTISDAYIQYIVKKGDAVYQVALSPREKSWKSPENEILKNFVAGLHVGFGEEAKKNGHAFNFEFLKNNNGTGWTGMQYKTSTAEKSGVAQYGIGKSWLFAIFVVNASPDNKDVEKMFSSISLASETK